jgi:hypothetical protein
MRLTSVLSGAILALSLNAQAKILPDNNLHLQDHPMMIENMTEDEFVAIIERVETYYAPIVESHGGNLLIEKRWNDSTVNAYAQRQGKTWKVSMFGGLARRPEVTPDGFMLVVCHELGHHLGGFPFARGWASNEGQSDFFATQACAKNIWGSDTATNASFRDTVEETAKAGCDAIYTNTQDQDLCYRSAMGGKSLATLLGALGKSAAPSFLTPDTTEVASTNNAHPKAQCRLDTYFNGALCNVDFDENFIPGVKHGGWFGNKKKAEQESLGFSCSQFKEENAANKRPRCWFKQTIDDSI